MRPETGTVGPCRIVPHRGHAIAGALGAQACGIGKGPARGLERLLRREARMLPRTTAMLSLLAVFALECGGSSTSGSPDAVHPVVDPARGSSSPARSRVARGPAKGFRDPGGASLERHRLVRAVSGAPSSGISSSSGIGSSERVSGGLSLEAARLRGCPRPQAQATPFGPSERATARAARLRDGPSRAGGARERRDRGRRPTTSCGRARARPGRS